jgi:hypothetical protein
MQLAPLVSKVGFRASGTSGIEAAHCHHCVVSADNGVRELPESAVAVWETISPMAAPAIPKQILRIAFSLYKTCLLLPLIFGPVIS